MASGNSSIRIQDVELQKKSHSSIHWLPPLHLNEDVRVQKYCRLYQQQQKVRLASLHYLQKHNARLVISITYQEVQGGMGKNMNEREIKLELEAQI